MGRDGDGEQRYQRCHSIVRCHAGQVILYGTVSVVRDPAYRHLWVSGLCSNMARWMDLVAVGWIALQMTGSPFMVAVAAFARSAPMMALGPFAGIVADRVSRAHLLPVTQAGCAVIALAFLAIAGRSVVLSAGGSTRDTVGGDRPDVCWT
jgi:MFS family permease